MKSQNGISQGGEDFDPTELPDQPEDTSHTKPAPPPGLPISEKEYNRLKEEAEHAKPTRQVKDNGKTSRKK